MCVCVVCCVVLCIEGKVGKHSVSYFRACICNVFFLRRTHKQYVCVCACVAECGRKKLSIVYDDVMLKGGGRGEKGEN